MQWYLAVLKNYVGFSGRARRKEYWMFTLINAIVGAIINVIQLILGLELPYLSMLYLLATFLPVLALAIRRLHDTDRSGAWALLFFVPFIGWLVLLGFGWLVLFVFACLEGNSGSNRYGNDPKFGSN